MKKILIFVSVIFVITACGLGTETINIESTQTVEARSYEATQTSEAREHEKFIIEATQQAEANNGNIVEVVTATPNNQDTSENTANKPDSHNTPQPSIQRQLSTVWDFDVTVNQVVGKDGFINDTSDFFELVVRLNQEGEILTGEYIGANRNACTDAKFNGTIQGETVNWTVQYLGSCCRNERVNFVGTVNTDNNRITGIIEPVEIPTTNCNLWYADFSATKR